MGTTISEEEKVVRLIERVVEGAMRTLREYKDNIQG